MTCDDYHGFQGEPGSHIALGNLIANKLFLVP